MSYNLKSYGLTRTRSYREDMTPLEYSCIHKEEPARPDREGRGAGENRLAEGSV